MHDRRQRRHPIPVLPLLAVLIGAGGMLAACSSTAPTATLPSLRPPTAAPPSEPIDTLGLPSFDPETDAPEPSDTDTGSPGTPPCAIGELKASRGITEVAGDERSTEVVLVAAGTCSVDAFPTVVLRDADGGILVEAKAGGTGGIDLVGGVAYTSVIRLSNWCLGEPEYPVSIGVRQGGATLAVTGESFPDEGDLPACVHEDADPALSATAWASAP